MHERTRKLLGRLAFVGCCALPTLLTVLIIVWLKTPWYQRWFVERTEQRLQDCFGMRFEIQQIETLAPGAVRLIGVMVLDPETGTEVGRARMVQWSQGKLQMGVMIHQPELQSAQLPHAWKLFHDRFLSRPEFTSGAMRMAAADLTIHSGAGSATLRNLDLHLEPRENAARLTASFFLAGHQGTRPTVIAATRDRSSALPHTDWMLKTGDAPLPCSVLADYSPWMKKLGSKAEFLGSLSWSLRDTGWSIDLSGCQFDRVDLANIFDMPWRQLTGLATIDLHRCQIQDGRLTDVAGSFQVLGEGRIGRDLFNEAERSLGIQLHDERLRGQDIAYDHLRLDFQLRNQDLQFGARVMKSGAWIATKSVETPAIPAVKIANLVAPDHALAMPVSPQSMNLMDFLPLPHGVPDDFSPKPPRITLRKQL